MPMCCIIPGPMPPAPWPCMNGGPKPPGPVPTVCAKAHPPTSAAVTARPPITRAFFFMSVSNSFATARSVAGALEGEDFTEVFQKPRFFVTKFVRRRASNTWTHIRGTGSRRLVYILLMQGAPHILIVDDHREIRDLVSRALTKEGFRVSAAADGRAMRKVLADSRIDLILLDLMLPGEDGLSLCRSLRAEIEHPDHHADRQGRRAGPGDRPRDGSRRLSAQAVRQPRAHRAHQGSPATQPGDTRRRASPAKQPKHYRFDRWRLDTGRTGAAPRRWRHHCRSAPENTIC